MILALLATCGLSAPMEEPAVTPVDLLAAVDAVAQERRDLTALTDIVGGTFALEAERDAITEHVAADAPGFVRVWVQNRPNGQRVDLEPIESHCLSWDQAKEHLGFASKVSVHPGRPQPTWEWWQYPGQTNAKVSIGFDRDSRCARVLRVEHVTK